MQKDKIKGFLTLHFVIFLWGFTSILGALISLDSISLVWYRMLLASFFIYIYLRFNSRKILFIDAKGLIYFFLGGLLITIHWLLFFYSIKISSVSIAVSMLSTGAIMASIIEPIINKKKILFYQIILGIIASSGVLVIFYSEGNSFNGVLFGLLAAFFSVLFALLNSKLIKRYNPYTISFYELLSGVIVLTFWMLITDKLSFELLSLNYLDAIWLFILSSICTAYAFTYSIKIMKHISPYTLMISLNLEPIYAIILSLIIFKEKELLSANFYIGVSLILFSVFLNKK